MRLTKKALDDLREILHIDPATLDEAEVESLALGLLNLVAAVVKVRSRRPDCFDPEENKPAIRPEQQNMGF